MPHTEILLIELTVFCYGAPHHPRFPLIAGTLSGTLPLRLPTGWTEPKASTERAAGVVASSSSAPGIGARSTAPAGTGRAPSLLLSLSAASHVSVLGELWDGEERALLGTSARQAAPHSWARAACLPPAPRLLSARPMPPPSRGSPTDASIVLASASVVNTCSTVSSSSS